MYNSPQLELFELVSLPALQARYGLAEWSLADFAVGCDNRLYLLFSTAAPRGPITRLEAEYTAMIGSVDWAGRRLLELQALPLGRLDYSYHYLRPFQDGLLLLGGRCASRRKGPDRNALLLDQDGRPLGALCLGDGIQDCATTPDGRIITSYFDEGIFGNLGWSKPLGSSGLVVWDREGRPLWECPVQRYPIYDCYAMTTDSRGHLYFFYYDEWNLVETDLNGFEAVYQPDISGSPHFAVSEAHDQFLFRGGYGDHEAFYLFDLFPGGLGPRQRVCPVIDGQPAAVKMCSFLQSRLLFLTEEHLYGYHFQQRILPPASV